MEMILDQFKIGTMVNIERGEYRGEIAELEKLTDSSSKETGFIYLATTLDGVVVMLKHEWLSLVSPEEIHDAAQVEWKFKERHWKELIKALKRIRI